MRYVLRILLLIALAWGAAEAQTTDVNLYVHGFQIATNGAEKPAGRRDIPIAMGARARHGLFADGWAQ
jgi:hypothetical protein